MRRPKPEQLDAAEGKIVDFIDGKLRADSEAEQVRQDLNALLSRSTSTNPTILAAMCALLSRTGPAVPEKRLP